MDTVQHGGSVRRAHSAAVGPVAVAVLALCLLVPAVARGGAAVAPVASFSASPGSPLTGDTITFTSTSSGAISALAWDLDADGQFNDGGGSTAQRAFAAPGRYLVSLRASGPEGTATQSQFVQVANRPPVALFTFTPSAPVVGDAVSFAAAASDPDGSVTAIVWDLNGDGTPETKGPVASRAFPGPGAYTVSLAVTDSSGATTVTSQGVAVAPRPPTLLQPSPIVRLTTRRTRRGAFVLNLAVRAAPGSRVTVRCRGRSCAKPVEVRVVRDPPRPLRFPSLHHRMRAGVLIEVAVTAPDKIGKYTRFRLRRGRSPSRIDLCLPPGLGPGRCPPA